MNKKDKIRLGELARRVEALEASVRGPLKALNLLGQIKLTRSQGVEGLHDGGEVAGVAVGLEAPHAAGKLVGELGEAIDAGVEIHDDSSVVGDGAATPTDPTVEAARDLGADSVEEGAVDDSAAPSADMQSRLIHARGLVLSASGRLAEALAVLAATLDEVSAA